MIENAILLNFIFRHRDALLARFILFGLCVGFAELPADAWLVGVTHTLDYSIGGGPMIWRSPIWMPVAWEMVSVQFGYIGLLLWEKWGVGGLWLTGLLGAVNIPYYEEMARRIHWWLYGGCKMISFTPYYVIAGEFLIGILLAALASRLRRAGPIGAAALGLLGGAGIFIAYYAAFTAIDGRT